ncbi:hypothetical protein AALF20_22215 [Enterococcus avium]|uniref:hypothetical protein n=1 Tax=Enterococcus avium TaxID=33945 RepID=UPI003516EF7E
MSEEYSARLERLLAFTESKTSELNNSGWKEFTSSILRGSIAREKARDEADSLATSIWSKLNQGKQHLNSDQQIVLNVLKKNANQGLDELIVGGITYMSDEEINAIELSQQEELFQVLAAFAEWGMKHE